jgi:hypothetical protein
MTLFTSIDRKLDVMNVEIGKKAETTLVTELRERVTRIEVDGSHNAQEAKKEVKALAEKFDGMGWRLAGALAMAGISLVTAVMVAILKH